jgi:hypothetical protein
MAEMNWTDVAARGAVPAILAGTVGIVRLWLNRVWREFDRLSDRIKGLEGTTMTKTAAERIEGHLYTIGRQTGAMSERLVRIETLVSDFSGLKEQVHATELQLTQLIAHHDQVVQAGMPHTSPHNRF